MPIGLFLITSLVITGVVKETIRKVRTKKLKEQSIVTPYFNLN